MENKTEQENLKRIYNTLDWIDLGLVGVLIFYYIRLGSRLELNFLELEELGYGQFINLLVENTNAIGILLLLISLAVAIAFVFLTVKMRRARAIGVIRTGVRLVWNGFFILMDVSFLLMVLVYKIGG